MEPKEPEVQKQKSHWWIIGASSAKWLTLGDYIFGMSRGVKNTFIEAPGVSLGGSGVSIGGFKILRVKLFISCSEMAE